MQQNDGVRVPMDGGLLADLPGRTSSRRSRRGLRAAIRSRRWLLLLVALPTLIVGAYLYGFAADQYESEARFIVRGPQPVQSSVGGIGQLLGIGGGLNPVQAEAYSVSDYLDSHDAVSALQADLDLVTMFRRPRTDPLLRLWWPDPSAETLLKYYRRQVTITYSPETGITRLRVLAFTPEDADRIAERLLELGEQRVNELNRRAVGDTLRVANQEVRDAEDRVAEAQKAVTLFRLTHRDINPEKTSTAQLTLVAQMQGQLAQARAQQIAMGASISGDSPQAVTLANRIRALESQVATEASKLTGGDAGAIAPSLADYEALALKREFASSNYNAAEASYENAKLQALRQQLFVVRVVEPNMPELSLYPRRLTLVATVLIGLLISYGIGWLIIAGVREHAA